MYRDKSGLLLFGNGADSGGGSAVATTLFEVYAEDWGGVGSTFTSTSNHNCSLTGSVGYALRATELGKYIFDINNTNQYVQVTDVLQSEIENLAIFVVGRQQASTSAGSAIDFRHISNGDWQFITPSFNTNSQTNGWLYTDDVGNQNGRTTVTGEDTAQFYIRLFLLEGSRGRLFLNGGTAKLDQAYYARILLDANSERKFVGATASITLDYECSCVVILKVPYGKTFRASDLDTVGNALKTRFSGGIVPEPDWSAITV